MEVHDGDSIYRSYKCSSMDDRAVPLDDAQRAAVNSLYQRMNSNSGELATQEEIELFVNSLQQTQPLSPSRINCRDVFLPSSVETNNKDPDENIYANFRKTPSDQQSLSPAHTESITAMNATRSPSYSSRKNSAPDLEVYELIDADPMVRRELAELQAMVLLKTPSVASTSPEDQCGSHVRASNVPCRSAILPPSMQDPSAFVSPSIQNLAPDRQIRNPFLIPRAPGHHQSMVTSPSPEDWSTPLVRQAPVPYWPVATALPAQPSATFVPPCVVPPPALVGNYSHSGLLPRSPIPAFSQEAVVSEAALARNPAREGLFSNGPSFVGGDLAFAPSDLDKEDDLGSADVVGGFNADLGPRRNVTVASEYSVGGDHLHKTRYSSGRIIRQRQEFPQYSVVSSPALSTQRYDAGENSVPSWSASWPGGRPLSPPVPNMQSNVESATSWRQTSPKTAFSFQRTAARDDSDLGTNLFVTAPSRSRKLAGGRLAW